MYTDVKPVINDMTALKLLQEIKEENSNNAMKSNRDNTKCEPDLAFHRSFKNCIVFEEDLENLYENHTFKEEITIGPEVFQHTYIREDKILDQKSHTQVKKRSKNKVKKQKRIEFMCYYCGKKFIKKAKLTHHMKIHLQNNDFLNSSKTSNSRQLPYGEKCTLCPKKFRLKVTLEKHMEMHNSPNKAQTLHKCDICDKYFTLLNNLKRHLKMHSVTDNAYQCDLCSKSFKSSSYLRNHYRAMHSEDLNLKKESYTCSYCNKLFNNKWTYNRHKRFCLINPERQVKATRMMKMMTCDICQKTYVHKQSLIDHIISHMNMCFKQKNLLKSKSKQEVQCDICLKKFTRKTNLISHMESRHLHIINKFCKKCGKGFNSKWGLTGHEKKCNINLNVVVNHTKNINDSELKYNCDICPNKYKTKYGLICHIEAYHLNIKKYFCKHCKVRFARKWYRNCHQKKCLTQG